MKLQVKEVANLVGISVRTLHYYDEIELLTPKETTESGYRLYSDKDLERLQQILFFKELGFSLNKIKKILDDPSFNSYEALHLHKQMLLEKRHRLDNILETIEKTILHEKGEITMTHEEKFTGFNFSDNPYEQEARERWGDKVVDKANSKLKDIPKDQQQALADEFNDIYRRLSAIRHLSPHSNEAQTGIKEWYDFLNSKTGHHYSLEAFKSLGAMYIADERFTKNIDKFGEGLALFMCKAMEFYANQQS